MRKHIRIGDLLVDNGIITLAQLEDALKSQKGTDKKLGQVLIEQGMITEKQIMEILAFQLGVPIISLYDYELSNEIINSISEELIRRHSVFPFRVEGSDLYVAMADPLDFLAIDDLHIATGKNIIPNIAAEAEIEANISRYFGFSQEVSAALDDLSLDDGYLDLLNLDIDTGLTDEDAPVISAVDGILHQAINNRASDIHIEPGEEGLRIRFRIDGLLQEVLSLPRRVQPPLLSRIKLMADMDIAEKRLPQDGRFQFKSGFKKIDLRISSMPTIFGEKLVLRILDKEQRLANLNQLGFSPNQLELFNKLLRFPHGMLLVTGPTGSGKTTTLYAALNQIKNITKNIITIEDPVEYVLPGINQVQTHVKAGMNFATGLRSILRQDPDVIMVGEIRDTETAEIAVRAATTGHLVLSTLHTNDAASTLTRLVDMGIEPFLVGSSMIGVLSQRLVRRICSYCSEKYQPLEDSPERFFLGDEYLGKEVWLSRGKGCVHCNHTGYKGRLAIMEVLRITAKERNLILQKADAETIQKKAIENGMTTIKEDGLSKALEGLTTIQEIMRVTYGGEF